jgi:hypothetical protein
MAYCSTPTNLGSPRSGPYLCHIGLGSHWGRRSMTDYYPLVSRAMSALENDTVAARRALFEQLRKILSDQLKKRQPPASRSEIMRQRAALEAAIRKFEYESPVDTKYCRSDRNSADRRAQGFQVILKRARAVCSERLQELRHLTTSVPQRLEEKIEEVTGYLSWTTIPLRASIPHDSSYKTLTLCDNYYSDKDAIIPPDLVIVRNLVGVQLLDSLMCAAAEPMALDSVVEDARMVLKWLGIRSAEEIDARHYEQFAGAVHKYALEYQNQSVSLAPSTAESPLELNSDIRGVLSRLLERAQTERFLNIALSWFGTFWIGLFIVLNLAALISLPAVGGITKLEEIYSPLSLGTWIAEILALSPGVIAIWWKDRRMRHSWGAAVATLAPSGSAAPIGFNAPLTSGVTS